MSDKKKDEQDAKAPEAEAAPAPVPGADGEAAILRDRLLRLQADFDNFRKRTQREKAEWSLTANEAVFTELLAVIDNFERGLRTAAEHKTEQAVQDGFQMVYEQMINTLRQFSLVPVDVRESGFDHTLHEAVAHVPSAEYPADEIIQQIRRGWKLGEKLLRPVQVVVSSGPGAPRDDEVRNGNAAAGGDAPVPESGDDTKAGS